VRRPDEESGGEFELNPLEPTMVHGLVRGEGADDPAMHVSKAQDLWQDLWQARLAS
jgi:hypothetical protein